MSHVAGHTDPHGPTAPSILSKKSLLGILLALMLGIFVLDNWTGILSFGSQVGQQASSLFESEEEAAPVHSAPPIAMEASSRYVVKPIEFVLKAGEPTPYINIPRGKGVRCEESPSMNYKIEFLPRSEVVFGQSGKDLRLTPRQRTFRVVPEMDGILRVYFYDK